MLHVAAAGGGPGGMFIQPQPRAKGCVLWRCGGVRVQTHVNSVATVRVVTNRNQTAGTESIRACMGNAVLKCAVRVCNRVRTEPSAKPACAGRTKRRCCPDQKKRANWNVGYVGGRAAQARGIRTGGAAGENRTCPYAGGNRGNHKLL